MSAAPAADWFEANQRYLLAVLAGVRRALEQRAAVLHGESVEPTAAVPEAVPADSDLPAPPALATLCESLALSPFERDVLLLCAGMELDARFAPLCAAAQGDPARPYPTFGLALAALPEAHWSALTPAAPLRRWRLVEVGTGSALTASPLRIDERILHYLAGVQHLDERLAGLVEPVYLEEALTPSQQALAGRLIAFWSAAGADPPLINGYGSGVTAVRALAAAACAALGLPLYALRAADMPVAAGERAALVRLWEREAVLAGAVLLVEGIEDERAIRPFLERARGFLIVASREPWRGDRRPVVRLEIGPSRPVEQQQLWQHALGPLASRLNGQLPTLVSQFSLDWPGIRAASAALGEALDEAEATVADRLWDACRTQARPRLDDLASRIEPTATWEDLVLPEAQRQLLRTIAVHLRWRAQVYETWGFAGKSARGLGISALFVGASGTGKTMAAEVLAGELRLDLYRIDLSQVVSKYIGETEKNLRRVFEAAEAGGAILLFDEADALFGKRTEVKDSHDRYANIEVSYLLARMETYRGLAVLTTNLKSALDTAFLRRIRFIVEFPFPDAAQRAEIWRRVFPVATPTEGLDSGKLARLNVAGGNIRNIALNAAFLAADADEPVRMAHLLRAARSEYAKLEKPLTDTEIGGW